jgi:protocatechuate 3,4-dioxygenase beta subunit
MKRRIGVVAALAAAIVALVVWRCTGEQAGKEAKGATPRAQAKLAIAAGAAAKRVDPRTLKRASIAGTITDATKKAPLAGARVCADGYSYDAPADAFREPLCTTSDAAGAYRIDNLLAGTYVVSAVAKSFRPGFYEKPGKKPSRWNQGFKLAAGEAKTGIDIALDGGGVEVTGTVNDITGGPVAQAMVRASAGRWGGVSGPPVTTDDKGQYSIWVKPGPVRVRAAADGYAEADEEGDAPGTIDLLLTPESSLAGIVVDAATGQPVEGARVSVQTNSFGWDGESDRTDAQGKFRVQRLTPGRYVAEARTERGYGRTEGSVLVGLGQHVDEVVVKLHPAMRIEGKVMIGSGDKATVCEDGYAWFHDAGNNRWVSARNDDGTLTADGVVPGTYSVRAGCAGYASTKDKWDPVTVKDKDVTGLVWEVEDGATIKGKVLTKRGEPVGDADVSARTTGGDVRANTQWSGATSKADGSYELAGLRPGTYLVEPSTDRGVTPREGYKIDAPAGKTVERDLVLDDGGRIEGTVVDEKGTPVAGVRVNAHALARDFSFRWGDDKRTDANGKFVLDGLRAGDYRVMASRGWFETLRKPGATDDETEGEKVTVRVAETASVRLVVESQNGTIKGVVVDAEGKPVSDAYLAAARESDAAGAQQSNVSRTRDWDWGNDNKPVLTNVDGTFTITKLSPGKYTVRAYRKGGGEAVVEHVPLGANTRLQIRHTGSIEGIAKREGSPHDEVTIELVDLKTGFHRSDRFYKTGGKFTLRDLPQGHFHLTASTEGGRQKLELDLAEGEHKTGVELVFESLVTITGRIVDHATKQPVPGMRVFAQAATAGRRFSFRMDDDTSNISDATGRFTVKRVPRGQIYVTGMAKEWKDAEYNWFSTLKTIDGTESTVDVGDVTVMKRRTKPGEKSGKLGLNFKDQPEDTPPDKLRFEVSYIDPKGPAVNSGIKVGDVITSIDGVDITGGNSGNAWTLMSAPPGTTLSLGLARNETIKIVLAEP